MTIHRPTKVGRVGKIDSWGLGSWAWLWEYPTLGLSRVMTTTSLGGVQYPTIQGVRPTYAGKAEYAPLQEWGQYTPTYHLPDGRTLVARIIENERCFVEI